MQVLNSWMKFAGDEYIRWLCRVPKQETEQKREEKGYKFIDKNSKKMNIDLRNLLSEHMGSATSYSATQYPRRDHART